MARRRKQRVQPPAETSGRDVQARSRAAEPRAETNDAERDSRTAQSIVAGPPRRHIGFLVASGVALAAWLAFLLYLALRG